MKRTAMILILVTFGAILFGCKEGPKPQEGKRIKSDKSYYKNITTHPITLPR